MELIRLIRSDLARISNPSLINFLKCYFFPRGGVFPYTVWLRIMHACKKNKAIQFTIGIIAYFIWRHFGFKYGISANPNIKIGPGLYICHGYGVYLNCSQIGANFTVFQDVTLGASRGGGIPEIKDNVTVYAGAVVAGNIVLNDNAVVGANSFVNKDVSTGSTVVGLPAREVRK